MKIISLPALILTLGVAAARFAAADPIRVALTFDDGIRDHLTLVAPLLEERGWRGTFNLVTDWIGRNERTLSWDDVRELVRRGHEIATHTKTHPSLTQLYAQKGADAVRAELTVSRDRLADETGFAPRFLCTPFCQQDETTAALCRENGLRLMDVARHNFGSNNCDNVRTFITGLAAKGVTRIDLLHHGVDATSCGGWRSFTDRESFRRHLDTIAELEREGLIIVTDYDGLVSSCALRAKAWPRHGIVALSFDDRNFTDWRRAFPLFARYDAHATFFACGPIGPNEIAFMREALAAGHEPGLHGLKHRNADDALAQMGEAAYWDAEMEPQLAACRAAGIPIRSFAYPNCRRTTETDEVFRRHGFMRVRGRDVTKNPNPYDPKGERLAEWQPIASYDPMFSPAAGYLTMLLIPNVILGESYHTDIEDILSAVRRAGERGEVLSIVSHGISPEAGTINMKTAWLERLLATAREAGVIIRGVR